MAPVSRQACVMLGAHPPGSGCIESPVQSYRYSLAPLPRCSNQAKTHTMSDCPSLTVAPVKPDLHRTWFAAFRNAQRHHCNAFMGGAQHNRVRIRRCITHPYYAGRSGSSREIPGTQKDCIARHTPFTLRSRYIGNRSGLFCLASQQMFRRRL